MNSEHQLQGQLTRHTAEIADILRRLNDNGRPSLLSAAEGGTGLGSYVTGDLLYASSARALSRLAGVATGNALISGGAGAAPSWGKIDLASHVTTTYTAGSIPFSNGTILTQDNANLFWDDTNNRLGIGTATPMATEAFSRLTVKATDNTAHLMSFEQAGTGQMGIVMRRDGGTVSRWYMYIPGAETRLGFNGGTADVLSLFPNGNIGLNTSTQFGGGVGVIGLLNRATAPSTNPTGGGVLYCSAGALLYRGSSGSVTTVAPA